MAKMFTGSALLGFFLVFLAFLLAPGALSAQTAAQNGEPFSLEPGEGDSPDILKYKAALRIFAGVQAVHGLTSKCGGAKEWAGYEKRNGNTL